MRKLLLGLSTFVFLSLVLPHAALAQEEENFIFGEYYVCDMNREAFADVLVEHVMGPIYQRHVDSGELTGWGWMAHHAGGKWRRLLYMTGNDLDRLLAARDAIIEEQQAEIADEGREFVSICGSHDDLIWASAAGPAAEEQLANLGPVGYSTYYVCDVARQERADEIVQELIAPHMNTLMESGQLTSWGWYAHVIGGQYRRLMTHGGMSHAALIDAVDQYNEAAGAENQAMADEFSQICSSHQDYLWNRVLPAPEGSS